MTEPDEESSEDAPSVVYGPIDYAVPSAPPTYCCSACGATQCKLWRRYQTFLDHQALLCGACALRDQNKTGPIDVDGLFTEEGPPDGLREIRTDAIGWLVPAVPTETGETFWGYTSVPAAGVRWWRSLPTTSSPERRP